MQDEQETVLILSTSYSSFILQPFSLTLALVALGRQLRMFDRLLVRGHYAGRVLVQAKVILDTLPTSLPHLLAEVSIAKEAVESRSCGLDVTGGHQQTGLAMNNCLAGTTGGAGHNWTATGHGFEVDTGKVFKL